MSKYRTIYVLALLLVLLGSACTEDALDSPANVAGLTPQCESDNECPLGTLCRQPYQICVTALHNPSVVAVAVNPPADADLPIAHLANVTFDENNQFVLNFPESVLISGTVKVSGNLAEPSVTSTIIAVAKDEVIKGATIRSQTNATDAGFSLYLIKGVPYTLTVKIDDADPPRPAQRFDVIFESSQKGVALTLPALDEYPVVTGRVYRVSIDGKQPLKDVQVTALHIETLEQCTSAVTNNLGAYEMRCPILTGPYKVLVGPTEDGPLIPSFTALFTNPSYRVNEIGITGDTDLPEIVIGEQSRETEVSIQVLDAYGAAISSVPVTLQGSLEDTEFWQDAVFRRTGLTDASGKITFTALEGVYHVSTVPHPSSPLAMNVDENWDVKAFPEKTVTLTNKVKLKGTFVSFMDEPIANTEVVARTTWLNKATQSTTVREYVTATNDLGAFVLPVDAGIYDIKISPDESTGLPRTWLNEQVEVTDSSIDIGTVLLTPPSLVEGRIVASQGTPLPLVSLDVYSQPSSGPAHLLARGLSDENGNFHLILTCPK